MPSHERFTALLVPLPALDLALVPFRRGITAGIPAHVTITVPFAWDAGSAHTGLGRIAAATQPFDVAFERSDWFHADTRHVLWLAPTPSQPFRQLIAEVFEAFPDFPQYGGAYDEPIPHVTVATSADEAELRAIDGSLTGVLPLGDRAAELALVRVEGAAARIERRWRLGG